MKGYAVDIKVFAGELDTDRPLVLSDTITRCSDPKKLGIFSSGFLIVGAVTQSMILLLEKAEKKTLREIERKRLEVLKEMFYQIDLYLAMTGQRDEVVKEYDERESQMFYQGFGERRGYFISQDDVGKQLDDDGGKFNFSLQGEKIKVSLTNPYDDPVLKKCKGCSYFPGGCSKNCCHPNLKYPEQPEATCERCGFFFNDGEELNKKYGRCRKHAQTVKRTSTDRCRDYTMKRDMPCSRCGFFATAKDKDGISFRCCLLTNDQILGEEPCKDWVDQGLVCDNLKACSNFPVNCPGIWAQFPKCLGYKLGQGFQK